MADRTLPKPHFKFAHFHCRWLCDVHLFIVVKFGLWPSTTVAHIQQTNETGCSILVHHIIEIFLTDAHLACIATLGISRSIPCRFHSHRQLLTKFPLMRSKMYRIELFCGRQFVLVFFWHIFFYFLFLPFHTLPFVTLVCHYYGVWM